MRPVDDHPKTPRDPETVVAGLSGGHGDPDAAGRLLADVAAELRDLAGVDVVGRTHRVARPWPHVAVSLAVPACAEGTLRAVLFRLPPSVSVVMVGTGRAVAGFGAPELGEGAYEAALTHWDRLGDPFTRPPGSRVAPGR